MTEEPYRWLEAIGNRREYISEQMKGATPVFAVSRPEGILMLGVGIGHSKVFEVYDRHGFAALGHPVDIEKLRQAAIESAHIEGFNRSSKDVTLRRLISFALSTTLKNSFEQIFAPPFIVEAIFTELGESPDRDTMVRVHYDGNHRYESSGVLVAAADRKMEADGTLWLREKLKPEDSVERVAGLCLLLWQAMVEGRNVAEVPVPDNPPMTIADKVVEAALIDRRVLGPVHYRPLALR